MRRPSAPSDIVTSHRETAPSPAIDMEPAMKVAAISGSLRKRSYNTALLRAAQELAPDDMEIDIEDISELPPYSADIQAIGIPAPALRLIDRIREADAVLIATPEYNYSIPGVLKNAIDWVSRAQDQPFNGKAVALMGAAPGILGTARAQYHLRQVFVFLNGLVMNRPEVFVNAAPSKFDDELSLVDQSTRDFLANYLVAVKDWSARVRRMNDTG
jgi:chromate reductase